MDITVLCDITSQLMSGRRSFGQNTDKEDIAHKGASTLWCFHFVKEMLRLKCKNKLKGKGGVNASLMSFGGTGSHKYVVVRLIETPLE